MSDHITPEMFYSMFISGAKSLESKKAYINELNVFPVPDGDTGTNMSLTLEYAVSALIKAGRNASLEELGKAVSSGALRGARGNSGVIMSQLIRGFSKELSGLSYLDKRSAAKCAESAALMARRAVASPKEGTILTVADAAAKKASELCENDEISMEAFLKEIIAFSDYTLSRTPEMLAVLKEAGVVDSGGAGLVEFYRGCFEAFCGNAPDYKADNTEIPKITLPGHVMVDSSDIETSDIKFTYCTEFIVDLDRELTLEDRVSFKKFLEELGDSLVFVAAEDMVKVHVHTNHPGLAFEKGLEFGSLTGMKIDNMKEEHAEKLEIEEESRLPLKEFGYVCVCSGEGIKEIFRNLSVDVIVEGGQTMNPSAQDIAKAIKQVRAEGVFVLPNNSNVILTAMQAGQLCPDTEVCVIPTKNIAQGISAVINYLPALSVKENAAHMTEEIKNIRTAEITAAVRDSENDGFKIKNGDYMALSDGHVIAENAGIKACACAALKEISDEDTGVISIYYGKAEDEELANELAEYAQQICPDADAEIIFGGQPVYDLLISAE